MVGELAMGGKKSVAGSDVAHVGRTERKLLDSETKLESTAILK